MMYSITKLFFSTCTAAVLRFSALEAHIHYEQCRLVFKNIEILSRVFKDQVSSTTELITAVFFISTGRNMSGIKSYTLRTLPHENLFNKTQIYGAGLLLFMILTDFSRLASYDVKLSIRKPLPIQAVSDWKILNIKLKFLERV